MQMNSLLLIIPHKIFSLTSGRPNMDHSRINPSWGLEDSCSCGTVKLQEVAPKYFWWEGEFWIMCHLLSHRSLLSVCLFGVTIWEVSCLGGVGFCGFFSYFCDLIEHLLTLWLYLWLSYSREETSELEWVTSKRCRSSYYLGLTTLL